MRFKKLIAVVLSIATLVCISSVGALNVSAGTSSVSYEYSKSKYYNRLISVYNNTKYTNKLKRVAEIAKSQAGYRNYWGSKHDWSGNKYSGTDDCNTEYTRWMAVTVLKNKSAILSKTQDCAWCAIFASWCMDRAEVIPKNQSGKIDYAYGYALTADPRIIRNAKTNDEKIENFNMDQSKVVYTFIMRDKLIAEKDRCSYLYLTDRGWVWNCLRSDKINYKTGGLVFFTWNKGNNFNHVGIILSWNKTNNILTYVAGNENGKVAIKTLNLYKKANKDKIDAYGEY